MKVRFPLSAKILLWFFLNLMLLGAVFYAFFRIQFHVGLDSLLAGQAGERIARLSNVIGYELAQARREDQTQVLERFGNAYGIRFFLYRPDGGQIAGETMALPDEVKARMAEFAPRPGMHGREFPDRPPPGRGGPDAELPDPAPPLSDGPDHSSERPPPSESKVGRAALPPGPPRTPPKFMVRTTHPVRYWVGIRLPPRDAMPGDNRPQFLLALSETLSGGGLFLEFKPWVLVGFGAFVVSVLFWLPMIRGITRTISQMTAATEQVALGHFDVQTPAARRDELGRLGQAINRMASRLAGFVIGQKRFLGDVAHELCSPIARSQVALGILEQRATDAQRAYVEDLREEIQHMSNLVNELLSFSKASLGASTIKLRPVPLREIANQAVSRESTDGAQIRLEIAGDLCVLAEPDLLVRSLSNLLRNAIRYAGSAGPITVTGQQENGEALVSVADCGPGVPEAALSRIFDPFYRLDASRDSSTGGVGLGLAIVKTCIESCRGTVTCRNREPSGLEVTLRIPLAPRAERRTEEAKTDSD